MMDVRLDYHTTTNYQRCLQRAYRCYNSDMNQFAGIRTNWRTVYLTPNSLFQVKLPKDFIDYRAVGVCVNGQMITLSLCEDICFAHGCDSCGNPISGQTINAINSFNIGLPAGYFFLPAWRNGQWVGEQYGIPAGHNYRGYYRFDYANGVIQFSSLLASVTEVVLEYVSSGLNLCGGTNVPYYTTEAITAFIVYQSLRDEEGRQQAKQEYWVEYEKVVTFVNAFTGSEAIDEFYAQTRAVARR